MDKTSVKTIMEKDYLKMDSEKPVSKLFGLMDSSEQYFVAVFDSKTSEFLGISSSREMLRKRADFSKMKVKNVTNTKIPHLRPDTSLMRAAQLMYTSNMRVLPVLKNETVLGLVTADALIRETIESFSLGSMKASEIASMEPIVMSEKEAVGKAINKMREENIRRIIAVDKSGRLSGILSIQGLVQKYLVHLTGESPSFISKAMNPSKEKVSPSSAPIANEISSEVKTLDKDEKIGSLLPDLESGNALVLVEKTKLVGIVTRRDLLEAIVKSTAIERNIQVVNAPDLDEIDTARVNKKINTSYDRIKRMLEKPFLLIVHFKQHRTKGSRTKHSVHARASAPALSAKVETATWNVLTSVQEALSELEREIKQELDQKKKPQK